MKCIGLFSLTCPFIFGLFSFEKELVLPEVASGPSRLQACIVNLISPVQNATLEQRRIKASDQEVVSFYQFKWSACPGATKYHIYAIGPGPNVINPIIDKEVTDTYYAYSEQHGGITLLNGWTWKVRAQVGGQWGEWSENRIFNVSAVLEVGVISGRVIGQRKYEFKDTEGNKSEVTLKYIILDDVNSSARRQVLIKNNGTFIFEDVASGKTYKIYPENFRTEPPSRTIQCVSKGVYRDQNFTTRPPIID